MKRFVILNLLLIPMLALVFTGCDKDNEGEKGGARLFKPGSLTVTSQDNTVTVKWGTSSGAVGYKVDLGLDTNFDPVVATLTTEDDILEAIFRYLEEATNYYARVRALAPDAEKNSLYQVSETAIKTGNAPKLFNAVEPADITATTVKLTWNSNGAATTITIVAGGETVKTYTLTAQDIANKYCTFTELTPNTAYKAEFRNGSEKLDEVSFTTLQQASLSLSYRDLTPTKATLVWEDDGTTESLAIVQGQTDAATYTLTATDKTNGYYQFTDLMPRQSYTGEIRNSSGEVISYVNFTLPALFASPAAGDITGDEATVKWIEENTANQLVLLKGGGVQETITLTSDINSAKSYKFTGLNSGVGYRAELRKDATMIDYVEFSTILISGTLVTADKTAEEIKSIIENAAENTVITFAAGLYNFSDLNNIILTKSITLQGEAGSKPVVYVQDLTIGDPGTRGDATTINSIVLKNLDFSGFQYNDSRELKNVEPRNRLINFPVDANSDEQNYNKSITLNTLEVENCIIRNYCNSFLNVPTMAGTSSLRIGEIKMNNSIGYDIARTAGRDAFILICNHTKASDAHVAKIAITNSTFYHLRHGLIEYRAEANSTLSVPVLTVDHCTFDYLGIPYPDTYQDRNKVQQRYLFGMNGWNRIGDGSYATNFTNSLIGQVVITDRYDAKNPASPNVFSEGNNTLIAKTQVEVWEVIGRLGFIERSPEDMFPNRAIYNFKVNPSISNINGLGDPRWNN